MGPLVANKDDLISVLDRVLDKGIVIDAWIRLSLQGAGWNSIDSKIAVASSAVYVGYGSRGNWRDDLHAQEDLFPFRRGERWKN